MIKVNFVILFLIFYYTSYSFHYDEMIDTKDWSTGKIALVTGEILEGKLKYDKDNEIVKIDFYGRIKAFSPWKVNYFIYYDETIETLRKYYSVSIKNNNNYERVKFYEAIYEGILFTLFSQSRKTTVNNSLTYHQDFNFWSPEPVIVEIDKFFLWKDNEIINYDGSINQLIKFFPEHRKQIKSFINSKGLQADNRFDLLKICMFIEEITTLESSIYYK